MSERTTLVATAIGLALLGAAAPPARGNPQALPGQPEAAVRRITLVGFVAIDESKLTRVCVRVPGRGRIDKLFVQSAGQRVTQGDPLAELFSREVTTATQSLLDAQRSGNPDLQRVARDRLRLWGIDDEQIKEAVLAGKPTARVTVRSPVGGHVIRKYQVEGDYVEEGARLYDVADLSTVWIECQVPDEADLAALRKGLPGTVTARAMPGREFSGEVVAEPSYDPDIRKPLVRFAVQNPRLELRPGMTAAVVLAVPADKLKSAEPAANPELTKAKLDTARVAFEATIRAFREGKADAEKVYLWSRRWMEAQRDEGGEKANRVAAVEAHQARMAELRKWAEARYQAGQTTHAEVLGADYYIAEAGQWLADAKGG